jgi:hypothetical protein
MAFVNFAALCAKNQRRKEEEDDDEEKNKAISMLPLQLCFGSNNVVIRPTCTMMLKKQRRYDTAVQRNFR